MTEATSKISPKHSTIDTVSMQHLCRAPAIKVKKPNKSPILGLEVIRNALKNGRLIVYLDSQGSLKDEWSKTCGHEIIAQTLIQWIDLKGIVFCGIAKSIQPNSLNKTLRQNKFTDTCDKLIVRIGLGAISNHGVSIFLIATNDGDFWHPLDESKKGNPNAPIASALSKHGLNATLLKDFFESLYKN